MAHHPQISSPPSPIRRTSSSGQPRDHGMLKRCMTCSKESKTMSCCAGCKMVYYCSAHCQRTDWTYGTHKSFCQKIQADYASITISKRLCKRWCEAILATRDNRMAASSLALICVRAEECRLMPVLMYERKIKNLDQESFERLHLIALDLIFETGKKIHEDPKILVPDRDIAVKLIGSTAFIQFVKVKDMDKYGLEKTCPDHKIMCFAGADALSMTPSTPIYIAVNYTNPEQKTS